jgi:hypothetical protein
LLRADVYSGDGNSANQTLGTFDAIFPRGAYYTPEVAPFLGPQNLIDLHPVIQFKLKTNVTAAFAWDWYWRESTHDGIYAFGSGVPINLAGASQSAISAIEKIWRFGGLLRDTPSSHSTLPASSQGPSSTGWPTTTPGRSPRMSAFTYRF